MYIGKIFGSVIFAVFAERIQQTVNITLKIF